MPNPPQIIFRLLAIGVAYVIGWFVYMIAMMMTVYDGLGSMIFQPIMAALSSGVFVLLAVLVGLVLKIPILSRWWRSSRVWAGILIAGSLFMLCFGSWLGFGDIYTDFETGRQFKGLHPIAAFSAYFCLIFAIANWPFSSKNTGA